MSKSNDQKVEFIIQFITEHRNEFTRCADAWKAFMQKHGKVSYVHFNRKFRELCPDLKPTKKVRNLRPKIAPPPPPPKNQDLKSKKREINYYHKILRDTENLLEAAINDGADKEKIEYYRDLRDRDRAAIVQCYEGLLDHYEKKIPDDIQEVETELYHESIRHGLELDRMLAKRTNMLINESDDEEEETQEDTISKNLREAGDIVKTTKVTKEIVKTVHEDALQS